jgi:hypothetical protein
VAKLEELLVFDPVVNMVSFARILILLIAPESDNVEASCRMISDAVTVPVRMSQRTGRFLPSALILPVFTST